MLELCRCPNIYGPDCILPLLHLIFLMYLFFCGESLNYHTQDEYVTLF